MRVPIVLALAALPVVACAPEPPPVPPAIPVLRAEPTSVSAPMASVPPSASVAPVPPAPATSAEADVAGLRAAGDFKGMRVVEATATVAHSHCPPCPPRVVCSPCPPSPWQISDAPGDKSGLHLITITELPSSMDGWHGRLHVRAAVAGRIVQFECAESPGDPVPAAARCP